MFALEKIVTRKALWALSSASCRNKSHVSVAAICYLPGTVKRKAPPGMGPGDRVPAEWKARETLEGSWDFKHTLTPPCVGWNL